MIRAIEDFLYLEARLLDERRFRDWLALYTTACTYWVPTQWGQADPLETVSLFYDDHMTLETRIGRLEHPRAWAQMPPSRTVHVVTNIRIAAEDEAGVTVHSALQFFEFRSPDLTHLAGLVEHRLVRADGALRIASKRIDLLQGDQALRSLQIPL